MKKLSNTLLVVVGLVAGLTSGQETSSAATITEWRSVKTHGSCGELPIVLNATATGNGSSGPTTETRGLATVDKGILKVQVDFDEPVSLGNTANITVTFRLTIQGSPATMGAPVLVIPTSVSMDDADTLNIVFASSLLPDQGCANIDIGAGTFVETITGDTDCNIRSLVGDVNGENGTGTVTLADFLQTKSQFMIDSLPTIPGKAKYDMTLTCSLTYADVLFAKWQLSHPTPTALCP